MKKIKAFLKNNVVERVYKTFIEAFAGAIVLDVTQITDLSYYESLLIAGVGAGLSAIWNLILDNKSAIKELIMNKLTEITNKIFKKDV